MVINRLKHTELESTSLINVYLTLLQNMRWNEYLTKELLEGAGYFINDVTIEEVLRNSDMAG
jgi:hypothetical protein